MDKLFDMEPAEAFKRDNRLDTELPLLGIAFDWRFHADSKQNRYIRMIIDGYRAAFRNAGAELMVLDFVDPLQDFAGRVDGYVIPGGRDMHPRFYGQEVSGAMVGDQPEAHFGFNEAVFRGLPPACPLLGICWGFQFLNVVNGGTMIQDLPDKFAHYKKRQITFKEGSWLEGVVGPRALGNCYHHQALDKLAPNIEPIGYDDHSNLVHAIQLKDGERFAVGILWHPEITFKDESGCEYEEYSAKILKGFVQKCREYKDSKKQRTANSNA